MACAGRRALAIPTLCGLIAGCGAAPKHESSRAETGVASFYSVTEAGHPTASGEPLEVSALTAASRTLPLGTEAEVTNTATGRSVHVRINDRGPYAKGRLIDVTPRAADALGMKESGTAPVRVRPTSGATGAMSSR